MRNYGCVSELLVVQSQLSLLHSQVTHTRASRRGHNVAAGALNCAWGGGVMGKFVDVLVFVGKNIAAGAVSYVGGQAAGYVLAEIFGTEGPTNQQMLDAINALGEELTGIENTLAEMQADLDENFAEIEQMLTKIDQQARYIAWQQVNDEVVKYVSQIQTQYSTYVEYAVAAASTSQQEVASLV